MNVVHSTVVDVGSKVLEDREKPSRDSYFSVDGRESGDGGPDPAGLANIR